MKPKFLLAGVAALATTGLLSMTAQPALADPPSGTFRAYVAVGSDTIQDVWNALSNGGSPAVAGVASYDAFTNPTTDRIQVRSGGLYWKRPAGSGDGLAFLSRAYRGTGTWDASTTPTGAFSAHSIPKTDVAFARSSSRPASWTAGGAGVDDLTYIPLARDAVSVAYNNSGSSAVLNNLNLTTSQLTELYSGVNNTANDTSTPGSGATVDVSVTGTTATDTATISKTIGGTPVNVTVHPRIPQPNSGTRKFFLTAIGVTTPALYVESPANSSTLAENDGASIPTAGDLIPFSAAQWISQTRGTQTSTISGLSIASINGTAATNGLTGASAAPGPLFGSTIGASPVRYNVEPTPGVGNFNRDTYNVVDTNKLFGDATLQTRLTSDVNNAAAQSVIQSYGFGLLSYVGSITRTAPYVP